MKFLITWQLHEGKLHDSLDYFSKMNPEEEQVMMGNTIRLLGRWHDLVSGSGTAVFESESVEAVSAFCLQWNRNMDIEITPVLDDAEARAVGAQLSQ